MAQGNQDGWMELEFNPERTQVLATLYPAQNAGSAVTAQAVMNRLRQMGVMYGFREEAIIKAVHYVQETGAPAVRVLVAQGILPEDGADAQILWKLPPEVIAAPLPRRPDHLPDYFHYDPARQVRAGQLLATVVPARPGSPGKTLTAPVQAVKQSAGREAALFPGEGVARSEDRLQFHATTDGFVELKGDTLHVYPLTWLREDLPFGSHAFPGGLILMGSVRGGTLRAQGVVAIHGATAGVTLRARGDVFVTRAARSRILTEGNVYVLGTLLHCEVNTAGRLIALDGATIVGGNLAARAGLEACDLGAADFTETRVEVGVDRFSRYRLEEVEEEIRTGEWNIQKIGQALRPLTSLSSETLPEQKKRLVQTLLEQRRGLEMRIRDLHAEKRSLMMSAKAPTDACVAVAGTVHPGVYLTVGRAALLVESPRQEVRFVEEGGGRLVAARSLGAVTAAGSLPAR